MRINENYEAELNLRDMFFHILYHWRSCLCAALIGAILLGGYQAMYLARIHGEGKLTLEEQQYQLDLEEYYDALNTYQNYIAAYSDLLAERNEYRTGSVWIALDSQNEWVATRRYYVQMEAEALEALPENSAQDPADHVAAVYNATLKSNLDSGEMLALLGTDRREYIDELVAVWIDNTANTIMLQTVGADEAFVTAAMAYFVNRLETVCAAKAQEVGAHRLVLVNEDVVSRKDATLLGEQQELDRQIDGYREGIRLNTQKYNELVDEDEPPEPGTHIKKMALIGFILGLVLAAGVHLIRYATDGRLHSAKEMTGRYAVPVYGSFAHRRARRSGRGLDGWLEKREFKHVVTDADTVYRSIAALMAESLGEKDVLLTGTVGREKLEAVCGELKKRLPDAVRLSTQPDARSNSGVIALAGQADAVILVEEKNVSRVSQIRREAEILAIGGAKVAGCIVL